MQRVQPGVLSREAAPANQPHNPVDARVNEVATQMIRIGAMILMAATVGVIASYGFFTGVAVFSAGILISFLIEQQAKTLFLDRDSQLTSAAKAEWVVHAHFWSKAVIASSLVGIAGALLYSSGLALLEGTGFSITKGLAVGGLGAFIGLSGGASAEITEKGGADISALTDRFTKLHDSFQAKAPQPALAEFIYKQYLSPKPFDELSAAIEEHQKDHHFTTEQYFYFLADIISNPGIDKFLEKNPDLKNWDFLLTHLSDERLAKYIGIGPVEKWLGQVETIPEQSLHRLHAGGRVLLERLADLPEQLDDEALNAKVQLLKAHKAQVETLQQRVKERIDAAGEPEDL